MIAVSEYENAEIDVVVVNSKRVLDKLNHINSQYALILMCKDYGNFTATEVVAYWADKYPVIWEGREGRRGRKKRKREGAEYSDCVSVAF
jgi:hypothetical protein